MSDETGEQAEDPRTGDTAAWAEPMPRCDHICLLDDGHVERGEPHFYGYESPTPRDGYGLAAEVIRLRRALGEQTEQVKKWRNRASSLRRKRSLMLRRLGLAVWEDDSRVGDG